MKSPPRLPDLPVATHRLSIDKLSLAHVDVLTAALTDARVYDYVQGSWPADAVQLQKKFERMLAGPKPEWHQHWWNFAIIRSEDGAGIGRLEATIVGSHAEIAYLLGSEYWQMGYGFESVQWLLHALTQSGLRTVYATIYPSNTASEMLLKKLGFDEIFSGWPELYSMDEGDRVFRLKLVGSKAL